MTTNTSGTAAPKKWFSTGYEGMKQEEQRLATLYGPNRIWIKPGGSAEFVFVDDQPCTLYEHNPKINGDYKNWLTCLAGMYEPVCCEKLGGKTKYFVGYYTTVDCTKWTDKKGNTHQFELKFYPAKVKTMKRLEMRFKGKGLTNQLWKSTRLDDKSPNVGDEFEIIRDVDMAKLFEVANFKGKLLKDQYKAALGGDAEAMKWLQRYFQLAKDAEGKLIPKLTPFNYEELLAPKSPTEVRSLLSGVEIEADGDGGDAKTGADEDIPF